MGTTVGWVLLTWLEQDAVVKKEAPIKLFIGPTVFCLCEKDQKHLGFLFLEGGRYALGSDPG